MSDQIDVNEIANTLQTKVDLPDGTSQSDCDFVIESQLPAAGNNYTWYRLYKSGWIEQGGCVNSASGTYTVTFPKRMADTNYTIIKTMSTTSTNTGVQYNQVSFFNKTVSSSDTSTAGVGFSWEVKGIAES